MDHELILAIGRLEGKVDLLLASTTATTAEVVILRDRVTALERWRSGLVGAWAVVAALVAYLMKG